MTAGSMLVEGREGGRREKGRQGGKEGKRDELTGEEHGYAAAKF